MMRGAFFMAAVSAILPALAQLAATSAATNIVLTSETVEEKAWKRQVVMKSGETGDVFNDSGAVGDAAETAAAGETADRAAEIGDAANAALIEALGGLRAATVDAATNAIALALVIAPETSRSNLTAYVVKTETDGITDTQWVWFNREIDLEPRRFVVYETYDRASTNKAEWVDWGNAVTVTQNGRTWEGCHVCTVVRPAWAQGKACLDKPNDTFGGTGGMDFGDLLLTCGNVPLYTGFVTNGVTGQVLYFDNGFNKGTPE